MKKQTKHKSADDLRGVSQLAIDATTGVTDLVEALHRNIARVPGITASLENGRTSGLTGAIYQSVRSITQIVGEGIDKALEHAAPVLGSFTDKPEREHLQSALNGVLGDHLLHSKNPLAISMQFRQKGKALHLHSDSLRESIPNISGKVLVLIHGLCMNDRQWHQTRKDGAKHDHGTALQNDFGYTPVYLHYNSGLNIAHNGEQFSNLLEEITQTWPVAIEEIVIVAHSMGGLVTRSAHYHASKLEHSWPAFTQKIVFLGTPHHGAPLERGGHWFDTLLGATPYASPFAKIGKIRSAGITDLRYGYILDENQDHVPLPSSIQCFAIAGTTSNSDDTSHSDGLVQINSALGLHEDSKRKLAFPEKHQIVLYTTNHIQLLSEESAYLAIKKCIELDKK
jgi:pimeloyl-ACP methyl ester carboxylesterase